MTPHRPWPGWCHRAGGGGPAPQSSPGSQPQHLPWATQPSRCHNPAPPRPPVTSALLTSLCPSLLPPPATPCWLQCPLPGGHNPSCTPCCQCPGRPAAGQRARQVVAGRRLASGGLWGPLRGMAPGAPAQPPTGSWRPATYTPCSGTTLPALPRPPSCTTLPYPPVPPSGSLCSREGISVS